jgi:outer membrane protein assembly factor BamB
MGRVPGPVGSAGSRFVLAAVLLLAVAIAWPVVANEVSPRPLQRDTVLAEGGESRTMVVAHLDDARIAQVAREIAEAIGHETEVIDETSVLGLDEGLAPELERQNLVLVGNAWNNRAIFRLYIRELALCDDRYPGPGGWIVRTVCSPWTAGSNAVIVGASDPDGLGGAAARFVGDLRREGGAVTLPWAWRFQSGRDANGDAIYTPRSYGEADWASYREQIAFTDQPILQFPATVFGQAISAGNRYHETGNPDEVRRFQMAIDSIRELGGRVHEARQVEFRLKDFVIAWERMEADPSLSDGERAATAAFMHGLGRLWEDRYWSSPGLADRVQRLRPITNHPSNGTLGYLRLGMYLLRNCELSDEAREDALRWVESADVAFNAQEQSFKVGCDANGYQWWTTKHMIKYAVWRPDYDFLWNGNARLVADLMLASADNMGNASGFGDVGASLIGYSSHARYVLRIAARHYDDGGLRWISEHLHGGLPNAEVSARPIEPIDATGVTRIPWSRAYYDDLATRGGKYTEVPWSRTFDKIAFRAGFEPDEPYLLLDGIGGMGHGHDDCNSITRVTALDTIWLIDDAYALKTMYDHNGVFVARDGRSSGEAYAAELEAIADLPSVGMTRSHSPANGLRWSRNIFWVKDGLFVIVDDLECEQAGDYQTSSTWRCAAEGTLDGHRYTSRHLDRIMTIVGDGSGQSKAAWERHPGEIPAHVLRRIVSRQMSPGESFAYANALAWPERPEAAPELVRVASQAWRVERDGALTIVATGPETPGAIETDARMLLIGPESLSLVDATECSAFGEALLRASRPVTVELGREGTGVVLCGDDAADEQTSVSLAVPGDVRVGGEAGRGVAEGGLTRLELAAGRHVLQYARADVGGTLDRVQREASSWPEIAGEASGPGAEVATGGERLWRYDGVHEVLPHHVASVTAEPPCKPGRSSPVQNLVDGDWRVSTVSAMWNVNESPEVLFDLGESASIDRVMIYTWEGMRGHELAGVEMAVGDSPDAAGLRPVAAEFPIVGQAERDISRIRLAEDLGVRARYVRLTFTPATPEDAAYVAEVVLYPAHGEGAGMGQVNDLATWDLTGDGAAEVLVAGSDGKLHCLRADGSVAWEFEADGAINAVWAGEIDGQFALLAGSDDDHLYRIDAEGREVWKSRTYGYQPRNYQTGKVMEIEVARLKPDGPELIIAGADNWHLSGFHADGEELWHTYYYSHNTTFIATGDITGDGVREIFTGSSFTDTNWFDADGRQSNFQRTRIGPAAAGVTADLDGDGRDEMIAVGQTGIVASTVRETAPGSGEWAHEELWRIDTGCPQTSVVVADVDGDGLDDVVTAGKNGFIWALGAGGEVHWLRNAHNSTNDLLVAELAGGEEPVILAASDDGSVQVWSLQGELLRRIEVGLQVLALHTGDITGDGSAEILAVTTDGVLHALRP